MAETYPYGGRDLFAAPESYEYAPVRRADFVSVWAEQRRRAIQELRREGASVDRAEQESDGTDNDAVSLRSILLSLRDGREPPGMHVTGGTLQSLLLKFEMFRRLFRSYDLAGRRVPESEVAAIGDYVLFAQVLVESPLSREHGIYVSTLLKLTDALTSIPVTQMTRTDRGALIQVLEKELALVAEWCRMGGVTFAA